MRRLALVELLPEASSSKCARQNLRARGDEVSGAGGAHQSGRLPADTGSALAWTTPPAYPHLDRPYPHQSVFHQDPRYFYKGPAVSVTILYAVGTAFVAKGDNGHWQPDYSDMIGGLAAREILSPSTPTPPARDCALFMVFCWVSAAGQPIILIQEFVYRWLTTHVPKTVARRQPVLRDGTPVPLFP